MADAYHHGDLGPALLAAAVELARESGPDGVVLREATRRVGVSATAAYRHFADRGSLLAAVGDRARGALADAMEAAAADVPGRSGRRRAVARLQATGRAYVGFALAEPGLFRTGFAGLGVAGPSGPAAAACPPPERPDRAYGVLAAALDDLVAAGALPPGRRYGAEVAAWAAVHGLSLLLLDGVVASPGADPGPLIERTLRMVVDGL